MYALKARDKLHKREKEAAEERDREALQRAREQDAYHRGRTPDTAAAPNRPSASRRDAKVCVHVKVTRQMTETCAGKPEQGAGQTVLAARDSQAHAYQ